MKKSFLSQSRPGYNPYFLNGEKKVYKVRIFKPGFDVLFSFDWVRQSKWGSNNDTPRIEFDFEIKRKNSIDLNSKIAFYCKAQSKYADTRDVEVFIPCNLVNCQFLGEKVDFKTETSIKYQNIYSLDLNCQAYDYIKNPAFETSLNAPQYIHKLQPLELRTIEFRQYSRDELTNLGEQIKTIQDLVKEKTNKTIEKNDLEALLTCFNVTAK